MDYLIKVNEMSFTDAVEKIMGQAAIQSPVFVSKPEVEKEKKIVLPRKSYSCDHMMNYLMKRGIDRDIIRYCINKNVVYESYPYHNAVFVGRDNVGVPRYAALLGENFMGEAKGSDKHFAFRIMSSQYAEHFKGVIFTVPQNREYEK